MKRSDFLKVFGIALTTPTIFIPLGDGTTKEVLVEKSKLKRWPIYPDRNQWSNPYYMNPSMMEHNAMAYVKVKHSGDDYLVLVRESRIGGTLEDLNSRFEYYCEETKEKYIITNPDLSINGIPIFTKYNPSIHNH